ncbi:response regulator [Intestinimonas massiliensis]|uniref:response regulator transcription factor n=1 Tax=Intestinimonas massiliensis (ex Afouda et al. 2020) TaxID=1673721 RepID=UPI00210AA60F|nr:response regulator [Intestinimonas massiliensis (ex Afouda et al. 2020)]MCQ4806651.1 response regulator [Intestinimonas massiliensis (ex Afouda et al. 2020)]
MINTILVEDDPYIQELFAQRLTSDERFYLVKSVRDAFESETLCNKDIDLVLMDVQTLHRHSGLASGKRIRENWPHIKVVIMTSLVDPEVLAKARAGCADSLWYKEQGVGELLDVCQRTIQGEHIFPDQPPEIEMADISSRDINPVQLEILRCHIRGMSYQDIGRKFGISKDGVRWHIRELVRKGGFENTEALFTAAVEGKLIVTTLKDE